MIFYLLATPVFGCKLYLTVSWRWILNHGNSLHPSLLFLALWWFLVG
jgi:hypothetical protein